MAIALVANTAIGSSTTHNATTSAIDTSGASLLVVIIACFYNGGEVSLADSKSNTWTRKTTYGSATGEKVVAFFVAGGTVGSGHTFTVSSTGAYPSILVAAFSGTDATPFDQETGFSNTPGPTTTIQPGSLTAGGADYLHITGMEFYDGNSGQPAAMSIDSSFTIANQISVDTSTGHEGGALAYRILSGAATALNPTWTHVITTGLFVAAANHLTFKVASAAAAFVPIVGGYGPGMGLAGPGGLVA